MIEKLSTMNAQIVDFLAGFHLDKYLYYKMPIAAIVILLLLCLLARKRVILITGRLVQPFSNLEAEKVGGAITGFIRGLLVAVLLCLAFLSVENYLNFGRGRYGTYLNAYEFYHYYMGSKYAHEISYDRLYEASIVADKETGMKWKNPKGKIRNLSTGKHVPPDYVLNNPESVKKYFSEERWKEWVKDIEWFKSKLVTNRWNGVLSDKGYNGTPVWSTLVGGGLSNQVSTDSETGMFALSLLDLGLIALATGFVIWAFGLEAALCMLIVLGTSYMMKFSHMKGAYLRTDFTMSLIIAICLIRKNHYALGGVFTAYSVMARIFPAVFLFGLGAKLFWDLINALGRWLKELWLQDIEYGHPLLRPLLLFLLHLAFGLLGAIVLFLLRSLWLPHLPIEIPFNALIAGTIGVGLTAGALLGLTTFGVWALWTNRINRRYLYFFVAFMLTVVLLIGASIAYEGGTQLWQDYAKKIGKHNRDISPWRVGFKYVYIAQFRKNFSFKESIGKYLLGESDKADTKKAEDKGLRAYLKDWSPYTRSTLYNQYKLQWRAILACVLLFSLFAVRGLKDAQAFAYSFVPCYFLVAPTYYYYIMLLVPLLFFTSELKRPTRTLGVVYLLLVAMAGYYFYSMWRQKYPTYYWNSVLMLLLSFYMGFLALREKRFWLHYGIVTLSTAGVIAFFVHWWPVYFRDASATDLASATPGLSSVAGVIGAFALVLVSLECIPWPKRKDGDDQDKTAPPGDEAYATPEGDPFYVPSFPEDRPDNRYGDSVTFQNTEPSNEE